MTKFVRILILLVSAVLSTSHATAGSPAADVWPQWRGPTRDGRIAQRAWPKDLSEQRLSSSWSAPLGPGYSGPIVAADRVFVTETKDKTFEVVRAFDRATGSQLWETQWEGSMSVPFFAASNGSWIRATPAYDGERLYVAGMRDVLVCLDAGSGETLWKRDFVAETGAKLPNFGCVSSPLVVGNHVYVQAGGGLAKLDKFSGTTIWQALDDGGGMYGGAFSSPALATIAGVDQLVVQTRSKLAGVDLIDGTVLWSRAIRAFRGMNILTPTIIGDAVFTSSYGGRSTMLAISRDDSGWQVTDVWSHKSQGYMSSPVVVGGHIYLHLRNRRLVCLDTKTGEERWTTRPFGKYWSLAANGNNLLALDQNGELLLIEASPQEFKLIDRRSVADDAWAHVAVVEKQIFVRALDEIKVYRWQ